MFLRSGITGHAVEFKIYFSPCTEDRRREYRRIVTETKEGKVWQVVVELVVK